MWEAVFADVGVALLAILNAISVLAFTILMGANNVRAETSFVVESFSMRKVTIVKHLEMRVHRDTHYVTASHKFASEIQLTGTLLFKLLSHC